MSRAVEKQLPCFLYNEILSLLIFAYLKCLDESVLNDILLDSYFFSSYFKVC